MPSDPHTAVAVSKRELVEMDFAEALDVYTPNFQAVLPSNIPVERFKRIIITALNLNPDLRKADRASLFNACVKCAQDGLYPDGREAALVVYNTKVKNSQGQEVWVPIAQYMPMIQGIRKRMRNSGEILSATAEVVNKNDHFRFIKGEEPRIEHEPVPLGQDAGDPVGAYAIIKLTNGETLRDAMSTHDIERSRAQSKSANSLMWTKFWGEGAKKTVLRRCAKQAPADSELERLMSRDDERPRLPSADEVRVIPPRPTREQFEATGGHINIGDQDTDDPDQHEGQGPGEAVSDYNFVDADGVAHSYDNPEEAAAAMVALLRGAKTAPEFDALVEARETLVDQLEAAGKDGLVTEIMQVPRPPDEAKRPAPPKPQDLFTQTDQALREAAKGGLTAWHKAWHPLPQMQKDLVKAHRAEYEQIARGVGA